MTNETQNDPMEFLKNMWGNMGFTLPGMVTPTVDTDELGKRIADLKAVEGWLKSNLHLLQMTIQGLEMQRTTLMAFQQMSQAAQAQSGGAGSGEGSAPNPFLNPSAWPMPWNMMAGGGAVPPAPTSAPSAETPVKTPESSGQEDKKKR
jgi:hypothetical protein